MLGIVRAPGQISVLRALWKAPSPLTGRQVQQLAGVHNLTTTQCLNGYDSILLPRCIVHRLFPHDLWTGTDTGSPRGRDVLVLLSCTAWIPRAWLGSGFSGRLIVSEDTRSRNEVSAMDRLSDVAHPLVAALHESPHAAGATTDRGAELTNAVRRLRDMGDWRAIPYLLPYLGGDRYLHRLARKTVSTLASRLGWRELLQLDSRARQLDGPWNVWNGWQWSRAWNEMALEAVRRPAEMGYQGATLRGVLSFHPNGYVREAAVRALGRCSSGAEMPFLLIRRNDWVEPVRACAARALEARLESRSAPALAVHLPLVHRLLTCGRADHEAFVGRVYRLLESEAGRPGLESGFEHPDPVVRRACYARAWCSAGFETDALFDRTMRDPDPLCRQEAAVAVRARRPADVDRFYDRLRRDRSAALRATALDWLVSSLPHRIENELAHYLSDPSSCVRGQAAWLARGRGLDLGTFYRTALPATVGTNLCGCLFGLGEHGSAGDVERLRPYLRHETPRVRVAAVKALAMRLPREAASDFLPLLEDPSPKVSRAACHALLARRSAVPTQTISELVYQEDVGDHVRYHAVMLLAAQGTWHDLAILIDLAIRESGRAAGRAGLEAERFLEGYNRVHYREPDANSLAMLQPNWPTFRHRVSPSTRALVDRWLEEGEVR